MRFLRNGLMRVFMEESGRTTHEYALILLLVAVGGITALDHLGPVFRKPYDDVATGLAGSPGPPPPSRTQTARSLPPAAFFGAEMLPSLVGAVVTLLVLFLPLALRKRPGARRL